MDQPVQTALVLQGDGALGAYEYGVVKRLYEIPDFTLDIVSGVSIGAINAAGIAGACEHPVATLEALWRHLTLPSIPFFPKALEPYLSLYGNPHMYRLRYDYVNVMSWTSMYQTQPLRQLLDELVDFDKLNRADAMRLIVSATNVLTGEIVYLDNRQMPLTADHILASSSLPPGFPMTLIDGESYWDGGLFDNTPLKSVIRAFDANLEVPKRIFVVELFPHANHLPRTMSDVVDRVYELIFQNKLHEDKQTLQEVNDYIEAAQAIEALCAAIDHLQVPEAQNLHHQVQALRALRGYRRLQAFKHRIEMIVIENMEQEAANVPSDFSASTIRRRIEAGYRDTELALQKHGLALAPSAGHTAA